MTDFTDADFVSLSLALGAYFAAEVYEGDEDESAMRMAQAVHHLGEVLRRFGWDIESFLDQYQAEVAGMMAPGYPGPRA